MRSASGRATLKHNPGTETRDKGRGRPLIINHVGHYLADSLSLAPSHTHTHIYIRTQRNTLNYKHFTFLSLPHPVFIYPTGTCFVVSVVIPFELPHNFVGGQLVTNAVIRLDSASLPGRIVCVGVCVHARASVCSGPSDSLPRVPGKRHQFIWRGEKPPSI